MYKRSKKIMAMVLSAAMVLSMTAVTRAEAADKKDNIEIRLASRWGGEEPLSVYFQQKIEEFNALDNGITIVGDHVTDEQQYLDKLSAQIGSGTQPEIFIEYGGTRIQDYVETVSYTHLSFNKVVKNFIERTSWQDTGAVSDQVIIELGM